MLINFSLQKVPTFCSEKLILSFLTTFQIQMFIYKNCDYRFLRFFTGVRIMYEEHSIKISNIF
jgi:hypothetical protein